MLTGLANDLSNSVNVTLFVPFRPMLCERANSGDMLVNAALHLYGKQNQGDTKGLKLLFETKFDGERVQVSNHIYLYITYCGMPVKMYFTVTNYDICRSKYINIFSCSF